jgi:hypothetical protein
MTALSVQEAQGQLAALIARAHAGEAVVLTDGDRRVILETRVPLDLEQDSPELEAELLKAVRGPHAPFDESEFRAIADRALREHRAKQAA